MSSHDEIIVKLMEIGAIKFGEYKLSSGLISPFYFDLRDIISYPEIHAEVSNLIWKKIESSGEKFDVICGVPYTALSIALRISFGNNIPIIMKRKEAKDCGTKKIIDGLYKEGSNCLIIDDVVTSGSSILNAAVTLKNKSLQVSDAVVLLNREQGGKEMLERENITLHSVFTISDVLDCLTRKQKITENMALQVKHFISGAVSSSGSSAKAYQNAGRLSFEERAKLCKNDVGTEIFEVMCRKRTNLCLSADVDTAQELIEIADLLGPHICMLKTHVDTLGGPPPNFGSGLKELSQKHDFVLFEDRKFADIGSTAKRQYLDKGYSISKWAKLINAHGVPDSGLIEGLRDAVSGQTDRACLLIAQMSSQGNYINEKYTNDTVKIAVKMAEEYHDFIVGFICTSRVSEDPKFIHLTPGVKMQSGSIPGQRYLTPDEVIRNRKSDIIIVGRGITQAPNRLQAAIEYKTAAWQAYLQRLEA